MGKIRELTVEEIEFLKNEGYEFLGYETSKRGENLIKIKHGLCGKIYNTRIASFFNSNKRCTCSRKNKIATIKNTEDFQNALNKKYGDNEYLVISEYINRKQPIRIRHKCGYEYEVKRAEYLLDKKENSGLCQVCNKGGCLSISAINARFKKLGLNIKIDNSEIYEKRKVKYLIEDLSCGHKYVRSINDIFRKKISNCPICQTKYRKDLNIDSVKNEISTIDNNYEVLSTEYLGTHNLLTMKHKICGKIYMVSRTNFMSGKRCPYCSRSKSYSEGEMELLEFIKEYFPSAHKYVKYENGKKKYELDVYIPELKIGIEYDGLYWHAEHITNEERYNSKSYHLDKTLYFKNKGIRVVHVFSDEWEFKKELVKDKLRSILNVQKEEIYARKCNIKEISSVKRNKFLLDNHIQGPDAAIISYGLFYNEELVAVMSLSKLRRALGQFSKEGYYELSRYAGKIGYTITGGFSKLLKNIIKLHPEIKSIKTYADLRWTKFSGNVYDKNGFTLSHISEPSYTYTKNYKKREYRYKFRKTELKKLFPDIYDDNKSEFEIMSEAGYDRVYDCGNLVYEYKVD